MIEFVCMSFIVGLVGLAVMFILCIIYLIKNEFTYRNQRIICDAIYDYQVHLIKEGHSDKVEVTFRDMEDYDTTLKRFWDWGYTRILPPEKFELIKPFIKC